MVIKEFQKYQVRCQPIPNGFQVSVSDGVNEKSIPLLPDENQVTRALEALEKTPVDQNVPFEYFSMIVAGCLMVKMKRSIGDKPL